MVAYVLFLAAAALFAGDVSAMSCEDVVMVTRAEWGARSPKLPPVNISVPVNMTFIHHSAGSRSTNPAGCIELVRGIQDFHMDVRDWNDIGYSFLVCEDGRIYEGRGWNVEGAHTLGYNRIAIGICFVGTFVSELPNSIAITAAKNLIQCGINKGFIKPDFELFGHRDGRKGTECPGDALYALIRTWPNYSTRPIHKYGTEATSPVDTVSLNAMPDGDKAKTIVMLKP